MENYMRALVLLAFAAVCGITALLLPDGAAAGLAAIAMIGLALAGAGNFIVGLRQ